ncbi:MAG: type I-F CRISPR-associated protein Csy1, partial [Desulfovibrio sp.]|nr:type I-F CRISPR-associated protein Csy1 [Desulfovibrio sp.]
MDESKEAKDLRELIENWLDARRGEKTDKKSLDDEEKAKISAKFDRETWIADAARRSAQIKLVTHAVKYIHPDARGAGVYDDQTNFPPGFVGRNTENLVEDVVGNAAALDVFKFLKLEYEGKSLLRRVREDDKSLALAFSDNDVLAKSWIASFKNLFDAEKKPYSHTLAKQIYFPLPDGGYHLLAPLFPTSLVQETQNIIREDRFGEEVKTARAARRDGLYREGGYKEYPGLLTQKFGGSKPQNISQLNSERHGENWLLPSCPPDWNSGLPRLPLGVKSVFGKVLNSQPAIRDAKKALKEFLEKASGNYTNINIRNKRAELFDKMVDTLAQWSATIREAEPGWTMDPDCDLAEDECMWLDPHRGEMDPDWGQRRETGVWITSVSADAANWVNR